MCYYEPSERKLLKYGVLTVDEDNLITIMAKKFPMSAIRWCCPPFITTRKLMRSASKTGLPLTAAPMLPEALSNCLIKPHRFTTWKCRVASDTT